MKKRTNIALVVVALSIMISILLPTDAAGTDSQEPLRGRFPYTIITQSSVDQKIAKGWVFDGDPYRDVGTAVPFTNHPEWSQVNTFYGCREELNYAKILITLAGLPSAPDSTTGTGLTESEAAVKEAILVYLESYEWRTASEYERAVYTAEYIVKHSVYQDVRIGGTEYNSAYSCLVKGISACDGFAQSYHLLTRAVGLKTIESGTGFHAVNFIKLDHIWYKIDLSGIANDSEINEKLGNRYADLAVSYQIYESLTTPAADAEIEREIWEIRNEFDFDDTIPSEPSYEG